MRRAVVLAALAACQGGTDRKAPDGGAKKAIPVADAPVEEEGPRDADEPVTEEVAAEDLGAIPAWRAVVDRDQLLKRRGQHGVVWGRVGGDAGAAPLSVETTWLIDETEGGGALAIRVHYPVAPPALGTRVAVGGAWTLDESRRWYWEAEAVTPLPPDSAVPEPLAAAPGHALVIAQPPPKSKVRGPDTVKEGEILQFTVVSTPRNIGDGWGVSTQKWGTLMGYLRLPGEHPSYGGHDMLAPDERWWLKKQGTYWVEVGKVKRKDGELATFEAASAPFRFY